MLKFRIGLRMCDCYEFGLLVRNLPTAFASYGATLHQGRNTIKLMDVEGIDTTGLRHIVVKRFHRPNVFQRLDYTLLRRSKAQRAYRNANRLRRRGLGTPENLAYVEEWRHGVYQCSYYVTTHDDGTPMNQLMDGWAVQGREGQQQCLLLVADFARFVARLHMSGMTHRDLNPSNVLCHWDAQTARWTFVLVDINRMRTYTSCPSLQRCMKDLLTFSAPAMVYAHFVGQYLGWRGLGGGRQAERIMQAKRRQEGRRHPVRRFFKRFDKLYYKLLG